MTTLSIHPLINKLIDFNIDLDKECYKIIMSLKDEIDEDEIDDDAIDASCLEYYNTKIGAFEKYIRTCQNSNILPFLQSGVIVTNLDNEIRDKLLFNINNFMEGRELDYHPYSNNKVIDIIHPSLYPLIVNIPKSKKLDFWNRPHEQAKYQWLPSNFEIDINGKCKIKSYINNLPKKEKTFYSNIETLFELILPEIQNCWDYCNSFKLYYPDNDNDNDSEYDSDNDNDNESNISTNINLKNRTLQVITKIVKINLKNKEDLIGAWHIEGMPHENIVITASYTLQQDEHFNAKLYFKRFYSSEEAEELQYNMPQLPIHPISKTTDLINKTLIPLGKVNIQTNNLIVFPNSHVHKIDMNSLSETDQTRTIIVFWIINPDVTITSTNDLKQQKYSLSKAHEHRLELMKERTYHKQNLNQRELNLCEH